MAELNKMMTNFKQQKKLIKKARKQLYELEITLEEINELPLLLQSDDGEFLVRFEQKDF